MPHKGRLLWLLSFVLFTLPGQQEFFEWLPCGLFISRWNTCTFSWTLYKHTLTHLTYNGRTHKHPAKRGKKHKKHSDKDRKSNLRSTFLSWMNTMRHVTDVKVLCSDVHQLPAGLVQPLIDDCVCTFTVERELPLWTPNCKHKYTHLESVFKSSHGSTVTKLSSDSSLYEK